VSAWNIVQTTAQGRHGVWEHRGVSRLCYECAFRRKHAHRDGRAAALQEADLAAEIDRAMHHGAWPTSDLGMSEWVSRLLPSTCRTAMSDNKACGEVLATLSWPGLRPGIRRRSQVRAC
jgi:hypothetical protein